MSKRCVVCGVLFKDVRKYHNANTCDPLCTRAKHAKRTREEQIIFEVDLENHFSPPGKGHDLEEEQQ